ncbi:MAG: major capsid protein [Desulfovibrionaceae bacterium]
MAIKTAFPIDPALTGIAIAWRNPEGSLIAEQVMPLCPSVDAEEFTYLEYDMAQGFTVPQTGVGRKGRVTEIDTKAEEKTGSTKDYGLEQPVPEKDIKAAGKRGVNLTGHTVEMIMNLLDLDEEIRVAGVVQSAANYDAAQVETLAGTDQWTDPAADPLDVLSGVLDDMIIRPNIMVLNQKAFGLLRRHPNVIKAIYPSSDGKGSVTKAQLIEELQLDDILVGKAFVNNARPGQDPAFSRTWGAHVALHYRDKRASTQAGVTWGLTVPFSTPVAGAWPDKDIGLRGGTRVRCGRSRVNLVLAKLAGYLVQNVY